MSPTERQKLLNIVASLGQWSSYQDVKNTPLHHDITDALRIAKELLGVFNKDESQKVLFSLAQAKDHVNRSVARQFEGLIAMVDESLIDEIPIPEVLENWTDGCLRSIRPLNLNSRTIYAVIDEGEVLDSKLFVIAFAQDILNRL